MARYANGQIPLDVLVWLGGEHYLAPGTAVRWQWLVRAALEKYGVRLYISEGANGYRWYAKQVEARNALGIWAAVPGYSSHGGSYNGSECMAIDVANWAELGWARFVALCRLAGFTTNFVTPEELWHIGDFNDIWSIPEHLLELPAIKPAPIQTITNQGDDMTLYLRPDADSDSKLGAGSDAPLFRKGHLYINDRGGAWRGITDLESYFYESLVNEKKISIQGVGANDMEKLIALNGICEQVDVAPGQTWAGGSKTLHGLGAPTGRIKFPGADGEQGDWHYPRVTAEA